MNQYQPKIPEPGYGNGRINATCDVEKSTHVSNQMQELCGRISEVQTLLENLYSKISPILRDTPPEPGEEKQCAEPYLVKHADELRTQNRRLTASVSYLNSIISRIEL